MNQWKPHIERLEVFDLDGSGVLSFNLQVFLQSLPEDAKHMQWFLFVIEVVGIEGKTTEIPHLESGAQPDMRSIRLSSESLIHLASEFKQVINMKLFGIEIGQQAPTLPLQLSTYSHFVLLEVIDSAFWVLESDMDSVLEIVKKSFRDVRSVYKGSRGWT